MIQRKRERERGRGKERKSKGASERCSQWFSDVDRIILFIWLCQVLVVAFLVAAGRIFGCGTWTLLPRAGIEPRPLHLKCGVLVTGP